MPLGMHQARQLESSCMHARRPTHATRSGRCARLRRDCCGRGGYMWLGTSAKMSATPSAEGMSDSYLRHAVLRSQPSTAASTACGAATNPPSDSVQQRASKYHRGDPPSRLLCHLPAPSSLLCVLFSHGMCFTRGAHAVWQ